VHLGNHVDILTGFPFKSAKYTEDKNDIRLIRGDNVAQGHIRWDGVKKWNLQDGEDYSKYELRIDDVILAMDRPWIEAGLKYAWITSQDMPSLLVQRVARLRGINGLETNFLRYIIASPSFTDYIKPIVTGVAVPHISADQIKSYIFILPPIPVQRRIVDILSAYDDLIENNTRRIRILEQMAQAIYQEWFGKVDKESLPEGWNVVSLSELADVNSTNIKNGNEPEEINYVDIASVSTGKIDLVQPMKFSEAPGRARRIVQHGDVIWSTVRPNRKSYSLIINPPENMIVSTGFAVLRAKNVPFSYLYLATTTEDFAGYLTNHATGSAYPAVNSSDFENAEIVLPPTDLLNEIDRIANVYFTGNLANQKRQPAPNARPAPA
jgi:type I restriction enzyme, S subunit